MPLVSALLLILNPGEAPGETGTRLTAVNVIEGADRSRIELVTSAPPAGTVKRIDGTDLIVCELPNCQPDPSLAVKVVQGRHVKSVRVIAQERSTLIEIALTAPEQTEYRYFIVKNTPQLVIDLLERETPRRDPKEPPSAGTPPAADVGASKSEASGDQAAQEKPKRSTKPKSKPSSKSKGGASGKGKDSASNSSETDALIEKGKKAIAAGEIDRGLSYLEVAAAAMKSAPEQRDLYLTAARLGRTHGLYAQAERFYSRLSRGELPDSLRAAVPLERGDCLVRIGSTDRGLAQFDTALARASDPRDQALVRRTRAEHLLDLGRGDDAIPDLEALTQHGRDAAEGIYAGYRLGAYLADAGRADEAIAALAQVSAGPPAGSDSVTSYFVRAAAVRRADILYRGEKLDEALSVYQTIATQWPASDECAWALFQIANVERRTGRFEEAVAHYDEVVARWPGGRWSAMCQWGSGEAAWLLKNSGGSSRASRRAAPARPATRDAAGAATQPGA